MPPRPRPVIAAARWLGLGFDQPRNQLWVRMIARLAQARAERLHARMRADLFKSDEWLGDAIAFAGERE